MGFRDKVKQRFGLQSSNPSVESLTKVTLPPPDRRSELSSSAPSSVARFSGHDSAAAKPNSNKQPIYSSPLVTRTVPDLWTEAFQELSNKDRATLGDDLHTSASSSRQNQADVNAVLSIAKSKRGECDDKRWKFNLSGQQIILRDVAEKIVSWITKFRDVGDLAASFDPVYAGPVWAGLKIMLGMVTADSEQMAALLTGTETVTYLVSRCKMYEILYLYDGKTGEALKHLCTSIRLLYTEILHFMAQTIRHYNHNTASRMAIAAFSLDTVQSFTQKAQVLAQRIEVDASNCERAHAHEADDVVQKTFTAIEQMLTDLEAPILRTDQRVANLWDHSKQSKQYAMLTWISDVPYEAQHKFIREKRTEGTALWLLNHSSYTNWRKSSASTFLWLYGIPGAGKSVLVSSVIDDMVYVLSKKPNDEGLAYFYCKRNEASRDNSISILQSLVRQLSIDRTGSAMQPSMIEIYDTKIKTGFASGGLDRQECENLLLKYTNMYPQTTLVLDALDECNAETQRDIIKVFDRLVRDSSSVIKVFISSRPSDTITFRFGNGPNVAVAAYHNQDDIDKFVATSLADHPRRLSTHVKRQIIDTLSEKSQGMFQWAVLQIAQLLQLKRESDMLERLGRLPADLSQAYDEIYEQIQCRPGSEPLFAERILKWIIAAGQDLTSYQLIGLACQDPADNKIDPVDIDSDFVLSACANLVVLDDESNTFRLSHLSVEEYLEQHRDYDLTTSHDFAACVCLKLLLSEVYDDFPDAFGIQELGILQAGKSLEAEYARDSMTRASTSSSSLTSHTEEASFTSDTPDPSFEQISYAIRHWYVHVQQCEQVLRQGKRTFPELMKLMIRFLGSPTDSSLEYRRWVNRLPDGRTESTHIHDDYLASLEPWNISHIHFLPETQASLCMAQFGLYEILFPFWDMRFANPNARGARGETLLMICAGNDDVAMCQMLIDLGACVDSQVGDILPRNFPELTALHIASLRGCTETVELLLRHGADPNAVEAHWGTPLQAAIIEQATSERQYGSIVRMLLSDDRTDVNKVGGTYGTALVAAAMYGDLETVRLLLTHGATVELGSQDVCSALQVAITSGHAGVIKLLQDAVSGRIDV